MEKLFAADAQGAVYHFESAVEDFPDSPDAHSGMGTALVLGGDAEGALDHLKKALNLGDARAETRLSMGNAHKLLDEYDEAAACYRDALARRPDLAPAHFGMSYIYSIQGMHGYAAESAGRAMEADPLLREAATIRNIAVFNDGRRQEAARLMAEAARSEPASDPAKIGMAYALLASGDADGALEWLDGVVGPDLFDAEGHCKRGRKLSRRGDHAGAYKAYVAATRTENLVQVYARMAASFVRMHSADPGDGWRAEALELVLQAVGKDTSYAFAQYERAAG